MLSFGKFPGVLVIIADVSESSIGSIFMGRWMKNDWDGTCGVEPKTPGNYPKENILHTAHGESLK